MREMRDSGVAWIGEIPEEWSLIRFKDKYKNSKEIAGEKSIEYQRLALTLNGVVQRPKNDSDGLQPKEFDTYQVLHENDFVFKMIDLQNISTYKYKSGWFISIYRASVTSIYQISSQE